MINDLDESDDYLFTDMEIASGSPLYWSFPGWPSHLDHILITNELLSFLNLILELTPPPPWTSCSL